MAIDLSKIGIASRQILIEPRDIYAALPKKQWPYLRLEQGEVLEAWYERRTDRDIVIKQNTGGGKTAVGLLIAQSSINEKIGPVVYLASDTYLVKQVIAEANKMGIAVVEEPSDPKFISHNAILVITFQRLVNGMSVFGVDGISRNIVELGTVIVDDAHAALVIAEDQFALNIPASHEFYGEVLTLFADALKNQSESIFREIKEGSPTALLRIPFWAWQDKQSQVLELVSQFKSTDSFRFQWPLMRDQFAIAIATITGESLDIRLPAPSIHKIPSFTRAKRRVYLTATLADDAILCQDLDANPGLISSAITPGRASDIGDRILLAPLELNPDLPQDAIRQIAQKYAHGWPDVAGKPTREPINVVVLVPSNKAIDRWRDIADRILSVHELEDGVQELKQGHVGLVVLANKYDGIDLAKNACRLLVIDGLPTALDAVERREASALVKSHKVIPRQVQRVEQGMGRGVRDSEDYCAVLLSGNDLTLVMHDPQRRKLFSRATAAQIELSHQLASQLDGATIQDITDVLDLCILHNQSWIEKSREALAKTEYESQGFIRPSAIAQREAFNKAVAFDFRGAASALQAAVDNCDDPAERGWLIEQQASYTHHTSPGDAQRLLLSAQKLNGRVLRPVSGVSIERIRAASVQSREIANYIKSNFRDSIELILAVKHITESVEWDKERTNEAELGWESIGKFLGFASQRPDKEYATGPDNLWALTNGLHLVTELKTGALNQSIKKTDIDQLGGSIRWFALNYGETEPCTPIMLHPSSQHHQLGTPPSGTRIITPECLTRLKNSLNSFAGAINSRPDWDNEAKIEEELYSRKLTADTFVAEFTVPITLERH